MDDPKTLFQINAYLLAKKEAARLFRNKIFHKTGLDLEQEFYEEIVDYVAMAAVEGLKIQHEIFTINVVKTGGNQTNEPGEEDDDETKH
jgi:hypothetical protein